MDAPSAKQKNALPGPAVHFLFAFRPPREGKKLNFDGRTQAFPKNGGRRAL